jgi:death-on-curing protein
MPKRKGYSFRHRGQDFPTVAFVDVVHGTVLTASGGRAGVLKPELLESAIEKPVVSVGGEDAYPTLFSKVAAIGHSIAHGHVFQDGNKRTAVEVMLITLSWNGFKRRPNLIALETTILLVAAGYLNAEGLRMALLHMYGLDPASTHL